MNFTMEFSPRNVPHSMTGHPWEGLWGVPWDARGTSWDIYPMEPHLMHL